MNIDERKAKLGTGKRFAALEKKLSHKKGIRDPAAVAAAHGRKTLGKKRFQELAAAGRRRHNESAEQIVTRLLEDDGAPGVPGNTGAVYNPEILRIKIRHLMQQLGVDYPTARDIAMTQHDPSRFAAQPQEQVARSAGV